MRRRRRGIRLERCNAWRVKKVYIMTENELWTGCVTDFRAMDLGRKKSWCWEPDFRAMDLGRKKSRVRESIFRAGPERERKKFT